MPERPPAIPEWGRKLSGLNAGIWRASVASPMMRSPMTGLFLLDHLPDADAMLDRMDQVTRWFPALRQRIVEPIGRIGQPRMVVDPEFDISFHTAYYRLPEPGSWEQLLRHVRRHSMTDLDRDRPLWRATLIDGLAGGRAAIVLVVHHAIADGQGMVMIIAGLMDWTPASVSASEAPPAPPPGRTDRWTATAAATASGLARAGRTGAALATAAPAAVGGLVRHPRQRADETLRMAASASRVMQFFPEPLSPLMRGRGSRYTPRTLDVPFSGLRAAAKAHGGTLNDGFLAGLTAGLRLYHEAHDVPVGRVRVNVPISLRKEGDSAEANLTSLARLELDAAERDARVRFRESHEAMERGRSEPFLPLVDDLVGDASRVLPVELLVRFTRGSDVTASNVPGIPEPVWMGGARLERMYPVVPTLGAAANITLLSYAGQWCSIGVNTDDAAVPDPDVFVRCLAAGFDEIGADPGESPADPLANAQTEPPA